MDTDILRALNDYYVAQVNWLVRRGRDDLIDVLADEYEREVAIARTRSERDETGDQAA
jgi:hypothetical protein